MFGTSKVVTELVDVVEEVEEQEEEKTPKATKKSKTTKKGKATTATKTSKDDKHPDMGTYGTLEIEDVDVRNTPKARIFASGNVGITNLRLDVLIEGEWVVTAPISVVLLKKRDAKWRKENDSKNLWSGWHITEFEGYDGTNVEDFLGEKTVKED